MLTQSAKGRGGVVVHFLCSGVAGYLAGEVDRVHPVTNQVHKGTKWLGICCRVHFVSNQVHKGSLQVGTQGTNGIYRETWATQTNMLYFEIFTGQYRTDGGDWGQHLSQKMQLIWGCVEKFKRSTTCMEEIWRFRIGCKLFANQGNQCNQCSNACSPQPICIHLQLTRECKFTCNWPESKFTWQEASSQAATVVKWKSQFHSVF